MLEEMKCGQRNIDMANIVTLAIGLYGPWTSLELQALADMRRTWEDQGVCTRYVHGISDEGDPWITFFDKHDESFVAHVARDTGEYLLGCSDDTIERSPALSRLLEVVRDRCTHDRRSGESITAVRHD